MFLDIRDFTPYVEKLSPEEIIAYQNKVLGFMIEVVNKRGGIVNQILGDGFMATFGAPVSSGNDCEAAYSAAREIINMVKAKSESGEIPPTKIGIGLHAGQVVAGNVGTKERKQYSITGNTVITAARLEQLNKEFHTTMVMSREVYEHLPEALQEPMSFNPVQVKGRSEAIEIATV
jgi:adenylate cyclase